ncbi:MAG: PIN domain-containing protein [Patescibacteria group bacterium]|nr:PIN domain-containing protein [Patescibacteria group bacterium]
MAEDNGRVFVDANFFVALFNPKDSLHKEAIRISRKLKKYKKELVVSNFIFLEVVTVVSQKMCKRAALVLGKELLAGKVEIIHVTEKLNRLSWDIFKKVADKDVSFVDCSVLAIMKEEEIKELLTFDKKLKGIAERKFQAYTS